MNDFTETVFFWKKKITLTPTSLGLISNKPSLTKRAAGMKGINEYDAQLSSLFRINLPSTTFQIKL